MIEILTVILGLNVVGYIKHVKNDIDFNDSIKATYFSLEKYATENNLAIDNEENFKEDFKNFIYLKDNSKKLTKLYRRIFPAHYAKVIYENLSENTKEFIEMLINNNCTKVSKQKTEKSKKIKMQNSNENKPNSKVATPEITYKFPDGKIEILTNGHVRYSLEEVTKSLEVLEAITKETTNGIDSLELQNEFETEIYFAYYNSSIKRLVELLKTKIYRGIFTKISVDNDINNTIYETDITLRELLSLNDLEKKITKEIQSNNSRKNSIESKLNTTLGLVNKEQ